MIETDWDKIMKINTVSMQFLMREKRQFRNVISTEEYHKSLDMNFYGKYSHIRKTLDYTYHCNYTEERQRFQNSIIDDMMECAVITDVNGDMCTTPTEPWLVFTAGAMGAGKGYTIKTLVKKNRFPLLAFVTVDPDEIRRIFPEYHLYVKTNPYQAGDLTRKEAGLVAEILTLAALQAGRNVLVDGTLRDDNWYKGYFSEMRKEYPILRIGILHVTAPRKTVLRRAEERAKLTGRVIPNQLLEAAIVQVPKSVKILAPLADYFCELKNDADNDIEIVTPGETWDSFSTRWLQTCAWVPGRRNEILKSLKQSLSLNNLDVSSYRHIPKTEYQIPRKFKFILQQRDTSVIHPCDETISKSSFQTHISIEENYRSQDMNFYGSFTHIRKTLDYNYHSNYRKDRQWLQDSVIQDVLIGTKGRDKNGELGDTPTRPWIIFTAGSKGAGKQYTINTLLDKGRLPLVGFVSIDFCMIRRQLPEYILYLHKRAESADDFTRKEVRYITEIATIAALQSGKNVILDGTLKDKNWYKNFILRIREDFKNYRIAILHISAPRETVHRRASLHAQMMGRKELPKEIIDATLEAVPRSCSFLRPYADFFCELNNPSEDDIEIKTEGINWDIFTQKWLQEVAWEESAKKLIMIPRR